MELKKSTKILKYTKIRKRISPRGSPRPCKQATHANLKTAIRSTVQASTRNPNKCSDLEPKTRERKKKTLEIHSKLCSACAPPLLSRGFFPRFFRFPRARFPWETANRTCESVSQYGNEVCITIIQKIHIGHLEAKWTDGLFILIEERKSEGKYMIYSLLMFICFKRLKVIFFSLWFFK